MFKFEYRFIFLFVVHVTRNKYVCYTYFLVIHRNTNRIICIIYITNTKNINKTIIYERHKYLHKLCHLSILLYAFLNFFAAGAGCCFLSLFLLLFSFVSFGFFIFLLIIFLVISFIAFINCEFSLYLLCVFLLLAFFEEYVMDRKPTIRISMNERSHQQFFFRVVVWIRHILNFTFQFVFEYIFYWIFVMLCSFWMQTHTIHNQRNNLLIAQFKSCFCICLAYFSFYIFVEVVTSKLCIGLDTKVFICRIMCAFEKQFEIPVNKFIRCFVIIFYDFPCFCHPNHCVFCIVCVMWNISKWKRNKSAQFLLISNKIDEIIRISLFIIKNKKQKLKYLPTIDWTTFNLYENLCHILFIESWNKKTIKVFY